MFPATTPIGAQTNTGMQDAYFDVHNASILLLFQSEKLLSTPAPPVINILNGLRVASHVLFAKYFCMYFITIRWSEVICCILQWRSLGDMPMCICCKNSSL